MKTSDNVDLISKAYVAAQADLKNAAFDKENPHFKSRYATLAQVRDVISPALAKHGLAVLQATEMVESGFVIATRMVHESGQWFESVYPFQLDKPQQMGSALTYARRYSLSAICGIASEEDDDGNAANASERKPAMNGLPPVHAATKTATRDDFKALCTEVENMASLATLRTWKLNPDNIARMEALNEDLADTFRESFATKVAELKDMAAA